MAIPKIIAEARDEKGKNKVSKLRKDNYLPGVIYGKGETTQSVQVDKAEFQKILNNYGTSALVDIHLNSRTIPVIIKEVQKDSVKHQLLHVDFQKLVQNQKIKLTLPITIVGRENVKIRPSIVMQQLDEVEIECFPKDIPHVVEADVSNLDFKTPLFVSDLSIAKNENINIFRDLNDVVATLNEPTGNKGVEGEEEGEETTITE